MRFPTLDAWLAWQETLHPRAIDLGLERVAMVARRLGLDRPSCTTVTIAGTNGKGSSVAMLEAVLRAAGLRVGAYTSPHLLRYNERIRLDGSEIDDASLMAAFERVDQARGDTTLSYFEFGTLAALLLFAEAGLDLQLLEVGLGGRLDAVNVVDADVALVTRVDLDHCDWLGDDRESIGREKAGIFRPGRPAVVADPRPPASLAETAAELGADLRLRGRDFDIARIAADGCWDWVGRERRFEGLPAPALAGAHQYDNAAGVLAVLEALPAERAPGAEALAAGLAGARLPGRLETRSGRVPVVLDVAHNPDACGRLARHLASNPVRGRTLAVLGVLADKDLAGMLAPLRDQVDAWYAVATPGPRGLAAEALAARLRDEGIEPAGQGRVAALVTELQRTAAPGDRILVFGSFLTVAEAAATGL